MSSHEKIDDELKDVDMCYKGMGIPFDSSPDEVERAYRSLTAEIKKNLLSADSAKRSKAKEDDELVNNLYNKIRNSVNYQRKLRERGYAPEGQEGAQQRRTEARAPHIVLKICPCCNNSVNKALKVCPFCRKRLYSSIFEKIWEENFTLKNISLTLLILFVLASAILIARNFNEISGFIGQWKK
ncbi:MAG: hypothetical protein ABSA06_14335 [Geobacteraceae bacterium]|jgi:hypothetical protein